MSRLTIGSSKRRPISRLIAKNVFSGLVTAWRFAAWPTRRSPDSVNATIEGVVRAPSVFSMTLAAEPSMTATHEFVVPRSIPMTLLMDTSYQKQNRTAPEGTVSIPREVSAAPMRGGCDVSYICVGSGRLQPAATLWFCIAGASRRDRVGKLSHRYSSILRRLVSEPAARRLLPGRQPLWRRRLRGRADPGSGRRLCLLDPQHTAPDGRSR